MKTYGSEFRMKKLPFPRILLCLVMLCALNGCAASTKVLKQDQPVAPVVPDKVESPPSGSIWPGESAGNCLFADRKARYINDVLTIVVDETSSGKNTATTKTSRDTATTAGIAGLYQYNPNKTFLSKYELGGSSTNSLKGAGDTSRDGQLSARITARVTGVLENGNLLIEGRRQLTVNEETQFIIISGIVRPDDITSDNVIPSQYIADAKIVYTGKGVVNDKMRPGWLTRIVDWAWPF